MSLKTYFYYMYSKLYIIILIKIFLKNKKIFFVRVIHSFCVKIFASGNNVCDNVCSSNANLI